MSTDQQCVSHLVCLPCVSWRIYCAELEISVYKIIWASDKSTNQNSMMIYVSIILADAKNETSIELNFAHLTPNYLFPLTVTGTSRYGTGTFGWCCEIEITFCMRLPSLLGLSKRTLINDFRSSRIPLYVPFSDLHT